tara:strand:- start:8 stop:610 length:603 start_codon:yes stop_codon:yes gene_type:complete
MRTYILANSNWNPNRPIDVTVTINSGVIQGAPNSPNAAFLTGNPFPPGSKITVINNGDIMGAGGNAPHVAGGTAISAQYPMTIQNNSAVSGGGGAGRQGNPTSSPNPNQPGGENDPPNPTPPTTHPGGAGGGGAGYAPGNPGASTSAGGPAGHNAGTGGGLGTAGQPSPQGSGGAAGYYIVSNGNTITWSATGTRRGSAS